MVAKPRFGAGCEDIRRYCWDSKTREVVKASSDRNTIWQPFVNGRFYSVGIIGTGKTCQSVVLPVVTQDIHWDDNSPEYRGGQIPARLKPQQLRQLSELILKIVSLLKVDDGYVGLDLVWWDKNRSEHNLQDGELAYRDQAFGEAEFVEISGEWQVVELNPRLCTSYLGYRKLFPENLAELWWNSKLKLSSINGQKTLSFDARAF